MKLIKRHKIVKSKGDKERCYQAIQFNIKIQKGSLFIFMPLENISQKYIGHLILDSDVNIKEFIKWFMFYTDILFLRVSRFSNININEYEIDNTKYVIPPIDEQNNFMNPRSGSFYYWSNFANAVFISRSDKYKGRLLELVIDSKDEIISSIFYYFRIFILALLKEDAIEVERLNEKLLNVFIFGINLIKISNGEIEVVNTRMADKEDKEYLKPKVQLYYAAFTKDEETFNTILESYLRTRKKRLNTKKYQDMPKFWIDYPALACCAYAYDRGLNITVKSEYIPEWIYEDRIWTEEKNES